MTFFYFPFFTFLVGALVYGVMGTVFAFKGPRYRHTEQLCTAMGLVCFFAAVICGILASHT